MTKTRSLRWRVGASFMLVAVMAWAEMMASLAITELAQGEARAVNIAGMARMRAYRLVASLQDDRSGNHRRASLEAVRALTAALHDPRLVTSLKQTVSDTPSRRYARLLADWRHAFSPPLMAYGRGEAGRPGQAWLAQAAARFVRRANAFVTALQNDSWQKIAWLRASQIVGMGIILVAVGWVTWVARRHVLVPLTGLLTAAAKVADGDFSYRVRVRGDDELARLGQAMNRMSESLLQSYATMEREIEARTSELARRNRLLELLYDVSQRLSEAPCDIASYRHVLQRTEAIVGVADAVLCLARQDADTAAILASDVRGGTLYLCHHNTCQNCLGDGRTHLWPLKRGPHPEASILSVPIATASAGRDGALSVLVPPSRELEAWQIQTLETVGRHIGAALGTAARNTREQRLALLEERHAMARDLHDSLAQALSYLKIQMARLRTRDSRGDDSALSTIVADIDEGLNAAYGQLRELLTTFRLDMSQRGLEGALVATAAEFGRRADVPVQLIDRLSHALLSANEEVGVLQIVREALTNVEHHARARRIAIRLLLRRQRRAIVRIDDDGVGIAKPDASAAHYGLAIMRERARAIRGVLRVERRRSGGTRVELQFIPAAYRARVPERRGAIPAGGRS